MGSIKFVEYGGLFVAMLYPKLNVLSIDMAKKIILASKSSTLRDMAIRYYENKSKKIAIMDIMADKVWQLKDTKDGYTLDAIAWLCKVLAKSNNPRYRKFLAIVMERAGSEKLRDYARASLDELPSSEAPQYLPEGINN